MFARLQLLPAGIPIQQKTTLIFTFPIGQQRTTK
jgi:hypothetical protein